MILPFSIVANLHSVMFEDIQINMFPYLVIFGALRNHFIGCRASSVIYINAIRMLYRNVEVRRFQGLGYVKRACIAQMVRADLAKLATLNYGRSCAREDAYAMSEEENNVFWC